MIVPVAMWIMNPDLVCQFVWLMIPPKKVESSVQDYGIVNNLCFHYFPLHINMVKCRNPQVEEEGMYRCSANGIACYLIKIHSWLDAWVRILWQCKLKISKQYLYFLQYSVLNLISFSRFVWGLSWRLC